MARRLGNVLRFTADSQIGEEVTIIKLKPRWLVEISSIRPLRESDRRADNAAGQVETVSKRIDADKQSRLRAGIATTLARHAITLAD
jgi:hypothetical protein